MLHFVTVPLFTLNSGPVLRGTVTLTADPVLVVDEKLFQFSDTDGERIALFRSVSHIVLRFHYCFGHCLFHTTLKVIMPIWHL